jgi:sporulation protein YabP
MAYEGTNKTAQRPHNMIMEGRTRLMLSGVEDVESFDDTEIIMQTTSGRLIVHGDGLQIEKLSLDNGELNMTGTVSELVYEEISHSGGFWSRLFK